MNKRKILITIPTLHGAGCERLLAELLQVFCEKYDVTLCLNENVISYEIPDNIKKIILYIDGGAKFGFLHKIKRFFIRIYRLYNVFKNENCDLILSFIDGHNINAVIANLLTFKSKPIVVSENTYVQSFVRYNQNARRMFWLNKILLRLTYNKSNRVIVVSEEMKRFFIERINIKQTPVIIYNTFDSKKFNINNNNAIPCELINTVNSNSFLCIGKFYKQKNHKYLIDSFKDFSLKYPNSKLFLLGIGDLMQDMKKYTIDNQLDDKVIFLGWRKDPENYIKNVNVCLSASDYEGFPLNVIEALACGCPVVTTDSVDFLREIPEEYIYVAKRGDRKNYVNAMEAALKKSKDRSYKDELSRFALAKFELSKISGEYINLIEDVCAA